ncbi:hypothetical protein Y032_0666g1333 [Ancylostoma ceylanicum]|uniref:Uncharacterized protein n=1 Tax=Ancylostoma ceylanicum TaxID=53326 RepID=A0A016WI06_9BILA|nr:hypothetical protein Y032_0666g1333 [Ancylostoma ceylanicum]
MGSATLPLDERNCGKTNWLNQSRSRDRRKDCSQTCKHNQLRCRDNQEGHVEKNGSLKVLLEVLAADDAYTSRKVNAEPNPHRAIRVYQQCPIQLQPRRRLKNRRR